MDFAYFLVAEHMTPDERADLDAQLYEAAETPAEARARRRKDADRILAMMEGRP